MFVSNEKLSGLSPGSHPDHRHPGVGEVGATNSTTVHTAGRTAKNRRVHVCVLSFPSYVVDLELTVEVTVFVLSLSAHTQWRQMS